MIRSKTPKDQEITEENLLGKSIVDPTGNIIAKCVGVFEDEKKKLRLRIAIRTYLDSDFIVEETIPVQLIKNIGEVILLKREYEIQPVAIEEIVTFDLPEEISTSNSTDLIEEDDTILIEVEPHLVKTEESEKGSIEIESQTSKKTKSYTELFNELFKVIIEEEDVKIRNVRIIEFVKKIMDDKRFKKKALSLLNAIITEADSKIRSIVVTIFNQLTEKDPYLLIPYFREGLESAYNEPSKDIEQLIINYLTKIATDVNSNIMRVNFQSFFDNLIIKRKICKNITRNRIHNLNLKIFVNNFYVQDTLIFYYLKRIIGEKEDAEEFAELLSDYNAIIITYSLIYNFNQTDWKKFLNSSIIKKIFEKPFIESIENILYLFNESNIKELSEIIDPKLGYYFSNQVIQKLIKIKINDVLAQVSILPLELLSSFFKDDNNRIIQIIFELINKRKIEAQILFIDGKTFVAPIDK